jgi:hypothetical protein
MVRADGDSVTTVSPSRPEARSRFGSQLGTSPHQQERDTEMLSYCGVDVSKVRLDVAVLPDGPSWSVTNDATGWSALVECL